MRRESMDIAKLNRSDDSGSPCLNPQESVNLEEVYPLNLIVIEVDVLHLIINWMKVLGNWSFLKVPSMNP